MKVGMKWCRIYWIQKSKTWYNLLGRGSLDFETSFPMNARVNTGNLIQQFAKDRLPHI